MCVCMYHEVIAMLTDHDEINSYLFRSKSVCPFANVNTSVFNLNWPYFEILLLSFKPTKCI